MKVKQLNGSEVNIISRRIWVDKLIRKVFYNFDHYSSDCEDYEVDINGVTKIFYHEPSGEGDKHYCDVEFLDKPSVRVFNINKVVF